MVMAKLPDEMSLGERLVPRGTTARPNFGGFAAENQALSQAGGQLERAGEVIAQTNKYWDNVFAEDGLNKLQAAGSNLENDPEKGFRNVQGGNAVGKKFTDDYMQRFNQSREQIAANLPNEQAREMFRQRADIAEGQYRSTLLGHQSRQAQVFADSTYEGGVKSELANIAANPQNDIVFSTSRARINALTDDYTQRKGLDPRAVAQQNTDASWNARIMSLIGSDPLAARDMFKAHRKELGAASQLTMSKEIDSAVMPVEAKNIADKVIPASTPGQGTAVDVKADIGSWIDNAQKLADKQHPGDPVFRDMVIQQVRGHAAIITAQYDAREKEAKDSLLAKASGLTGGQKPLTLDALLTTPEDKQNWMMLDSASQRGLIAVLTHNATPIKSVPTVVADLFQRIHLPDGNKDKITTSGELFPYFAKGLNREDYDWLQNQINEMQTPDGQRLGDMRKNFFAGIKPTFDKSTLLNMDAMGAERFYQFQHYATKMEAQYRKEGKDPYLLYDPKSPDYLGNNADQFKASLETQMNNLSGTITGTKQPSQNTGIIQRSGETAVTNTERIQALPKEGQISTSKSGKPIIWHNGKWEYQ